MSKIEFREAEGQFFLPHENHVPFSRCAGIHGGAESLRSNTIACGCYAEIIERPQSLCRSCPSDLQTSAVEGYVPVEVVAPPVADLGVVEHDEVHDVGKLSC